MRDYLAAMLAGNETYIPVILPSLLPKFLKVANKGKASSVPQLMRLSGQGNIGEYGEWWGSKVGGDGSSEKQEFRNLSLKFRHGPVFEWWEVGEVCSDPIYSAILSHLPFHDDVNPNTGDCPYLTIFTFNDKAFPAGLNFISGAGPKHFQLLCLDIYLVRESGELDLEEDLFAKLVFLYRSPETLIKWTRPKGEAIEAPPGPPPQSPNGTGRSGRDAVPRRARPEEDDDDESDDDDEPDDALVLMEDSGAAAPRAPLERS
ncbi:hypothetical protein J437_LFUL001060 [Ladona fulva]|uniref:Piezo non-specific cation channel cap domain-containing protein n=1 Tax=Ladona fulva TaxID=123851 RepID=A0A8K0P1K5_LADFU|nr:hypothetical protein J437_LFUL001060 [Ladona fulva]